MSILTPFSNPDTCPYCGSKKIHKYGKRNRHVIEKEKVWYKVQRYHCINYECGVYFTLLLPNMLPHKHYAAPEIEQVLKKQEDPAAPHHECGAEESTLRRWMREFPPKLSGLAAFLESLANISQTCLIAPLQRIYYALSLLYHPPLQDCLALAFFTCRFNRVRI